MIVSRDQIIDLEKSKNELVEATQNGTVVYHTNFPLKNTDTLQREKEVCQRYNYLKEVTNSGTVDKFSTKEGLTELLLNANPSTINNEETYLSFIAVFPKDINKPLEFYVLPVDTPKNRAVSLIIKFTANDTKKIYLEVQDQSGFGSLKRAA